MSWSRGRAGPAAWWARRPQRGVDHRRPPGRHRRRPRTVEDLGERVRRGTPPAPAPGSKSRSGERPSSSEPRRTTSRSPTRPARRTRCASRHPAVRPQRSPATSYSRSSGAPTHPMPLRQPVTVKSEPASATVCRCSPTRPNGGGAIGDHSWVRVSRTAPSASSGVSGKAQSAVGGHSISQPPTTAAAPDAVAAPWTSGGAGAGGPGTAGPSSRPPGPIRPMDAVAAPARRRPGGRPGRADLAGGAARAPARGLRTRSTSSSRAPRRRRPRR